MKNNQYNHDTAAERQPLILFVRGIPGSGKSFFTEALKNTLSKENVTVIDPDALDIEDPNFKVFAVQLLEEGLDKKIHPFRWLRKKAVDAANVNSIVIWNQPFTDKGIFDRLVIYLKEQVSQQKGLDLKVIVIEIDASTETAWKRVVARKNEGRHGPDKKVFEQRLAEYTSYSDSYDVISLNGEIPVEELTATVIKKIFSNQG